MTTQNTTPEELPEDLTGLKSKVAELFGKLKEADRRAEAAEKAKEAAAEAAADEKRTDLEKLQNRIKKLEGDLTAANTRADTAEKAHSTYKAETAIAQAIASNNVESHHSAILTSHFKALIDPEGNIEGQSVQDYAKAFFAKDGAYYCRAANNSGSGATGGDTSPTAKPFNETEYAIMKKTNPSGAAAWAKATGNDHLNDSNNSRF